jgi:hypothetical protein
MRREDQEFSRKKLVKLLLAPKEEGKCHSTMKATIECKTKRRREV